MQILVPNAACGFAAAVQRHGWLITSDRNGVFIRRRSANVGDIFPEASFPARSIAPHAVSPDLLLSDVLGAEAAHAIRNASAKAAYRPILLPRLSAGSGGGVFDVAVHIAGDEIVIELEPAAARLEFSQSPLDLARGMIDRLGGSEGQAPEELMASAAHVLAAGLRFDRVVLARAGDGSATAAAASQTDAFAPLSTAEAAGLRRLLQAFPAGAASRAIRDAGAPALPLVPQAGKAPDLIHAGLRGASMGERRALRALGAASCLLLPVIVQDESFGFFVCLNRVANNPLADFPSMEFRAVAELFVDFFSLRLEAALRRNPLRVDAAAAPGAPETEPGLSILIVEDEWLIAQDLEASLSDHGARVTAICMSVEQALQSLAAERPDAAVLDLMLLRGTSTPVAEALARQGVPFVFATGYGGRNALPDEFADVPLVAKPYDARTVLDAVMTVLARTRSHAQPASGGAAIFES
jgi:CheY-like chemotaxis protein